MTTQNYGIAKSTIFNVKKDKYGIDRIFQPTLESSTASGWSPTGNLPLIANSETINEEKHIEHFQSHYFYGYTVRELVDLDAVSGRVLEEADLKNAIHPIFSKNVWEKLGERPEEWHAEIPIMTKISDMCIMQNPIIYDAMEPVLILASAFLSRMHALPFIDALLLGPRRPMEASSSSNCLPCGLCTFWRRPPGESNTNSFRECNEAFNTALERTYKRLRWGFAPGRLMPWDMMASQTSCYAVTHEGKDSSGKDVIWIFLDQALCETLLRSDLTSAEKAGSQYLLAIVMCHELAHAIWYAIRDPKFNKDYEPFFEDAPQCELGYEFENSVFGGLVEAAFTRPAAPFVHVVDTTYPHYGNMHHRVPNTLVMDQARPYNDQKLRYFVPIQTFEDIRKQAFWDGPIRCYGLAVIHARSLKHGYSVDFSPDFKDRDKHGCPSFKKAPLSKIGHREGLGLKGSDKLNASAMAYHATQLPPERKASFKMLEDIMESATKEERFYQFTQEQEDNLWEVREAFASLCEAQGAQDLRKANVIANALILLLQQAIINHKEAFLLLHQSETLMGREIFRDRRATLFRWNVGTRRLLNDLLTVVGDNPTQTPALRGAYNQLSTLLCDLEYVRLQVFLPSFPWEVSNVQTPQMVEELKRWPDNFFQDGLIELNLIADLYTAAEKLDHVTCQNLSESRLQADRGASSISFYCRFLCHTMLRIIKEDIPRKPYE